MPDRLVSCAGAAPQRLLRSWGNTFGGGTEAGNLPYVRADTEIVLVAEIRRAERLLSSARLVGDTQDHRLWQLSVRTWVREALEGLSASVEAASLQALERAAAHRPSEGSLADDLPREIEDVQGAMNVLVALREQVARRRAEGEASGPDPARGFSAPLSRDG